MLSVRNAILTASLLLVVALVTSVLGMLKTPDSGGLGHDSFGTRGRGYRGLYEVLDELDVAVTRNLPPPETTSLGGGTLALLGPNPRVVGFEPSYLHALLPWVEQGGRILVAPREPDWQFEGMVKQMDEPPPTVLETLGLEQVELYSATIDPDAEWEPRRDRFATPEELAREMVAEMTGSPIPPTVVEVEVEGEMSLLDGVQRLMIPGDWVGTLWVDEDRPQPEGSIVWTDAEGERQLLIARYSRGRGEIIVAADPQLFGNRLIAGADNSVLAVQLIAPIGGPVVFDEFYHGLGVRGGPLYLLTRLPYLTVTLGLLLLLGVGIWRRAIFLGPSLPDAGVQRRDISEYINAMGRFFAVGGKGNGPLVQQVRDGVLRQISEEVGLPPDAGDVDRIAAAVARSDIRRGEMILEATRAVDSDLTSRRHWSDSQTLDAMQRMTDCLSKNATSPFGPN